MQPRTATIDLAAARGAQWIVGRLTCWRDRAGLPVDPPEDVAEPYALELGGKFEDAADFWREHGCPYEAALVLGRADDEYAMRRAHDELLGLGAYATGAAPWPARCGSGASGPCVAGRGRVPGATPPA